MNIDSIINAWDQADPAVIHPSRSVSENAYRESGRAQAELLATAMPAGCRVVDFGCGDGRVTVPLTALGYHVIGADASPVMLDRLFDRAPGIPSVLTDGTDLADRIGKKADAVVSLAVLIHHNYESVEQIITGLRDAVSVNGLLILDWPTADKPREGGSWISVTTWSTEHQDQICRRVGLKRLDSTLPWPMFRAVKASR
ncbi:class I SAM-dependent methyltransferase [Streptomyces olivoreticuli]